VAEHDDAELSDEDPVIPPSDESTSDPVDTAARTAVEEPKPFRTRHTNAQRFVLAVNLVVVLACFVAAGGLLAGKEIRENFQAVGRVEIQTTATASPNDGVIAPVITPSFDGSTPSATTEPAITSPPETFPPVDTQAIRT
jgi:hypothetical protein